MKTISANETNEQNAPDSISGTPGVGQTVWLPAHENEPAQLSAVALAEQLAQKYPLTVENFKQMPDGLVSLQYVAALDTRWQQVARGEVPALSDIIQTVPTVRDLPTISENRAFDLIYAGGVLGLFSAAVMARKGFAVMVFDQRQVGTSHREWNISDEELEQFVRCGLFSRAEIEEAVANRYQKGLVRFYANDIPEAAADLWLDRVLDVAIDLGKLLEMARQKFVEAGGTILDYRAFKKAYLTTSWPGALRRGTGRRSGPD